MIYLIGVGISMVLSVLAALAFLGYTYGQPLLGMGRRTIARLYALAEIVSMIVSHLDPKGWDYSAVDAFGSVVLAVALYLAWRWRDDDDDDFTTRLKRKAESARIQWRSFAPSPIPHPSGA